MDRTASPHDPEFLADLYRFACFLHGRDTALEVVESALRALQGKPEAREGQRAARFLFARIARTKRGVGNCDRLAAGLRICAPFPVADQARVVGCKPSEFQKMLAREPEMDVEVLREELAPDGDARTALAAWEEPELLHRRPGRGWQEPAVYALGFAFFLLVGLGLWMFLSRSDGFPGEIEVRRLLETGSAAGAEEYEPVELPLGTMGDWLALNGVEGFWMPPELAGDKTVAARIFTHQNVRVAAVALPERQMMVYIFDGAALGVEVRPTGVWRLFSQGKNAGAIAQRGRVCVMAAIRGTPAELRQSLRSKSARNS